MQRITAHLDPGDVAAIESGDKLPVVVGPTASGKTALAVELAETLGGEIVSADSVQIYRRFDVGTGKPSAAERARARHHLVDCVEPIDTLDAAQWAQRADAAIEDVRSRGLAPIVCGGAFLWVRALLFGLAEAPPADETIRKAHRELVEAEGRAALHGRLDRVDPELARKLAPNDFVRVSRALEVHELTGKPLSAIQKEHGFARPRHRAVLFGVGHERDALDARIEVRARKMMAMGWVREVRDLIASGLADARAMGSVGYRQIAEALRADGEIDEARVTESIVRATRVFARRQRTWLRHEPVFWLEPDGLDPGATP